MGYQTGLKNLFEKWSGEKVKSFSPLPESGSARKYFRIAGTTKAAIGAFNPDKQENRSFIYLSNHFRKQKLNVPKILGADLDKHIYLVEDLGDKTLFSIIESSAEKLFEGDELTDIYEKVVEALPRFQITGAKKLNFSKCYPDQSFGKESMLRDLNYFKYYFLKPFNIVFNEKKLDDDFDTFANFLLKADTSYFMYRDFNPRNIMIKNGAPYFIDYQGGRKGALQYDIASFLFSSKANFSSKTREELLQLYLKSAGRIKKIDKKRFLKYYYAYLLIRILQMLGAYGYRGYFEGKSHFLKSIPYAVKNLEWLLKNHKPKIKTPELFISLQQIFNSPELKKFSSGNSDPGKLNVRINSFSYRKKLPADLTGNGGGFVFDCRAIPNPGRLEKYKDLSGRDKEVKDFLDAQPEARNFVKETFDLIGKSVEKYLNKSWTDLMVNYGCTGGQHRSVYCAERLAEHLRSNENIHVILVHTNLD